ncbi:MAG TPA: orotidine-5'-phosphate decarboxylase [Firmicutes bacterium]|nr:orotidine-5'-phosphate decarboxylase [Bacillota bacterium]HBK69743.1 orotidine-5'-phosphate decarboxylase [Bacillota bacterium]
MRERIIIALDVSERHALEKWAETLRTHVSWVKVGMELFYALGSEAVTYLNKQGFKVFLDLKLHDIPNTVEKAATVLVETGAAMINLHCLGGVEMMKRTAERVRKEAGMKGLTPPKLIGVTILTSISEEILKKELQINSSMKEQVLHLATIAKDAGLNGVVASPLEVQAIKDKCGDGFLTIVPGIRPAWSVVNDQRRILTPRQALDRGADFLVIGRPVLQAADPVKAVEMIINEMEDKNA